MKQRLAAFAVILASLSRCAPPAAGYIAPWTSAQKEGPHLPPDGMAFQGVAGANCPPVPGAAVETWVYQSFFSDGVRGPIAWLDCHYIRQGNPDAMPSMPGCMSPAGAWGVTLDPTCSIPLIWRISISRSEAVDACNTVETNAVYSASSGSGDGGCDSVGDPGPGSPGAMAKKKPHKNVSIMGTCNAYGGWLGGCVWGPAIQAR